MGNIKRGVIFLILGIIGLTGCAYESLMYRTANDGVDKKEYLVVGRVTDPGEQPIEKCRIFLAKEKTGDVEAIPVGVTDVAGNYHLKFELSGVTKFWLYFDARDQGYPIRYESISHLMESSLFQYTGNNPIIVNVVINKSPLSHPSS